MNSSMTEAAAHAGWREWMSWIRPWYVGAVQPHSGLIEGHMYPDCDRLARQTSTPQEGAGWLNPSEGPVCASCKTRRAAREEQPA
ncbi:hypothetical protein [Nonomuraea sp. NPDC049646]|uniref:hypothetical protein n=1 Tax=unclassified Nonomuraea TaxID=2593643 RepID=UPI003795B2DE